jgi:dTDP-4-dehydrorhamnose 3,5-epimerase
MIFKELQLKGVFTVDLEPKEDNRGFYARAWCRDEFGQHGLVTDFAQINISYTHKKGTVRGLHYQVPPHGEVKLVRCVRGAIFDVVVDMRPDSPTYRQWLGIELSADNRRALYVPENFAHGFASLTDDCELIYSISSSYHPEAERGIRYNDPAIGIEWPVDIEIMSDKDRNMPDLED